jgi:hypothetical protein
MRKLILLAVILLTPSIAPAQRFAASKNGKDVIAHTRRAPVVIHKAFPPYGLGVHTYSGRDVAPAPK